MKLTRITKVRNRRIFRNFTWPNDLLPFAKFNVIYGWNGSGKTTLASVFRHIEDRSVVSEGEVELEIDGANKIEGKNLATAIVPPVRVFDRDFIESTIRAAGEKMSPIYYFGRDSAEKQRQIDDLRRQHEVAAADLAETTSKQDAASKALDNFYIERAKVVKEHLIGSRSAQYGNYDKRNFKRSIEGMTDESRTSALLADEAKEKLRRQKDAQPRGEIERVSVGAPDFAAIAERADGLLNHSVVSQLIDELVRDREVGVWVQRGLELHSGQRRTDTCRFCGQPLTAQRRNALEAHFNNAFTAFQSKISAELTGLERNRESLAGINFPDSSRLYDHLTSEYESAVAEARRVAAEACIFLESIHQTLLRKKDAPFGPSGLPGPNNGSENPPDSASSRHAIDTVNAVIEKHNVITSAFQAQVDQACEAIEKCYVAEAFPEYVGLRQAVAEAQAVLETARDKCECLAGDIATLERDIIEHRRPAEELNAELRAYLGHNELCLEVREAGYSLTRAGQPATYLSEGEKMAIAFLYFLKSLNDKAFDFANGIVVIDDPVSSLDANALFSAFGYMKERIRGAGQVFILTHNFTFFRQVKNWFHHLPGQRKQEPSVRPARFYLLQASAHNGQRSASLEPIDPLLEEYDSEYHYLFKRVHEEAQPEHPGVALEQYYGMPNTARRLLEAFLAFRYPDLQDDLAKRLESVDFEPERKVRILRLLHTYSHLGNITDPEHDPTVLSETRAILRDLLALIERVDSAHYEAMMRLVSAGGASD